MRASTATRLDTQTSDDVEFSGGSMDGVAIGSRVPSLGAFVSVWVGRYQFFEDGDGGLKIRSPDGTITVMINS